MAQLKSSTQTKLDSKVAAAIPNTPAGTIGSINVQAALNELDTKKQPIGSKGVANGYPSLNQSAEVVQLPAGASAAPLGSVLHQNGTWHSETTITPTLLLGNSLNAGDILTLSLDSIGEAHLRGIIRTPTDGNIITLPTIYQPGPSNGAGYLFRGVSSSNATVQAYVALQVAVPAVTLVSSAGGAWLMLDISWSTL